MGLFSNIFKKKAGGTFIGNLIRGVANTATGGLLGNGANMIPATQAPAGTILAPTPQQIQQSPVLQPVLNSQPIQQAQTAIGGFVDTLGTAASQVAESATKAWFKKNWLMLALPGGLVLVGFMLIYKRTGRR